MRTMIILILALLFTGNVMGAVLFDSEDFEGMTTKADILADAQFWCSSPPNCKTEVGTGEANFTLVSSGGNEYMSFYATGYNATLGNSANVNLLRNSTNISNIGSGVQNYTLKYDLKGYATYNINHGSNMAVIGAYALHDFEIGGVDTGDTFVYGGSFRAGTVVGHLYPAGVPTEPDWDMMRLSYDGSTQPYSKPYPTNDCNISDNDWHEITKIYRFSGNNLIQMQVYVDTTLCEEVNGSWVWCAGCVPFSRLEFKATNEAILSIDNIEIWGGEVLPTPSEQCQDGSDNDGDGYTDYPADPSCTSAVDDSESPYDYTQCNNGIDDDGDGYIDYPADPSCSGLTDTTESPRDDSPSEDAPCLVEEGCLLYEPFPYTDELNLHGWYGSFTALDLINVYGSNRLYFDTDAGTVNFNLSKNITNPNIYSSVNSDAEFFIDIGGSGILFNDNNNTFYWQHLDPNNRLVNSLRFDISRVSAFTKDFVKVLLFNYNGTAYEQVGDTIFPAHDSSSRIQFFLTFDQILKTYQLSYIEEGSALATVTDIPWANVLATKVNSIRLQDIASINDSEVEVYVDDFSIYSDDITYDTVCDEWSLPYYLRESFNGYPMVCQWSSNLNIFFTGQYTLSTGTAYYYQQKELPVHAKDQNTRYVTVDWDAEFEDIVNSGSTTLRLYDNDLFNFLTVYYLDSLEFYYNNGGTGTIAQSGIPLNQSFSYRLIIDLDKDNYDIFFNGTEVVSDARFTSSFYNLKEIGYMKLTSSYSGVSIDNLKIFASTDDGSTFIPDDEFTPTIEEGKTMCGIVHLEQPSCIDDDDCESGKCLVNHKCARWDANYCTENGFTYGNKCFLAGTLDCSLRGAGNLIVDNFFLFLVLLVLLMLAVYLTIMFRR